jgi:hypothetical protein
MRKGVFPRETADPNCSFPLNAAGISSGHPFTPSMLHTFDPRGGDSRRHKNKEI